MEVVNWIFNFVLGFVKWTFVFIVAHVWTGWFLIGLIVVFIFPRGPFILKLIPNNPSPTSFGITISPKTGIFEINLLNILAGTKVPLKLVRF